MLPQFTEGRHIIFTNETLIDLDEIIKTLTLKVESFSDTNKKYKLVKQQNHP